ncbi:MAG TPA: TIGR03086 family metal-binding protein [Nocardioides sp.]
MTATVPTAVELLERAVGYTRLRLDDVTAGALANPTPCRDWDLGQLLDHMDDALDAFTEASTGRVRLEPTPVAGDVLERLRTKACDLLSAWATPYAGAGVEVADRTMPTDLLLGAGALEIAVHGWDVGQATGHPAPIPVELARELLPLARSLVSDADRPSRFGPALPQAPQARSDQVLLGLLGRFG